MEFTLKASEDERDQMRLELDMQISDRKRLEEKAKNSLNDKKIL